MNLSIRKHLLICVSLLVVLACSCKLPVDTKDGDLLELERIWQYSKAYSIYTDRVPDEKEALSFDYPKSLVISIQDTMLSPWDTTYRRIGRYYDDWKDLYEELYGPVRYYIPVYFKKLSNNTAYTHIWSFESPTYYEVLAFTDSIRGISNIILDLRYDGGGFVDICKYIIELILPVNTPYLYEERREEVSEGNFSTIAETVTTRAPDTTDWGGKKIALLINRGSASAAEILAVALKCGMVSNNLNIFGEKSFGKGIGQYAFLFNTTSGAGLKLTGLRFKGISVNDTIDYHEMGILPDVYSPDSTRTLYINELLEAGKWLEPDFENTVDSLALSEVVKDNFNIPKHIPRLFGCYKIAETPDF